MTIELTSGSDYLEAITGWTAGMAAATDEAVLEVAAFGREKMQSALSRPESEQGSPPAERTGKLVGSIESIVIPSITGGIAVWTGTREFYGAFLNAGFHPNHSGHRRSARELKTLQRTSKGAGKVQRPYVDDVYVASRAFAQSITISIRLI